MSSPNKHIVLDIQDDAAASQTSSDGNTSYDNEFLHRVVEDTGRWAFGVILVELWVLHDSGTHLFRPQCGWWIDEYADTKDKFARLTDSTLSDYIPAEPLPPGVGLPGYLWSQSSSGNPADLQDVGSRFSMGGGATRTSIINAESRFHSTRIRAELLPARLSWCEVKPLADDPDQPYNPRLKFLAEAGLGLAAGVPFNMGGTQGIVVYMARQSASLHKLTSAINEEYLQRATMVIGSAYSLRTSRLAVEREKIEDMKDCWGRVRSKVTAINSMSKTLADVVKEECEKPSGVESNNVIGELVKDVDGACKKVVDYFVGKFRLEARKIFGANVKAPPFFSGEQAWFTFIASLITLAILTNIDKALKDTYGSQYSIVLPPFGALMALQYGLTAAPASQPRNAIIGQTLALCIAQGIGQASNLELWFRQSLATSLAVGVMVKFGVTHPPAGAAALVFSSGNFSWAQVGLMLMANLIAILCATLLNNWSARRQYPTFWGFREVNDIVFKKEKCRSRDKRFGLQYGLAAGDRANQCTTAVAETSTCNSTGLGVMVKSGVIHPPAAAAAIVFSSGNTSWPPLVGIMLVGNVIAILCATSILVNNWSEKRHYPTSWGFRPIHDFISSYIKKEKAER